VVLCEHPLRSQNHLPVTVRVIHIYEADFNLLLAVKWHQLLHHADTKGLLNPGQFGGRPSCEAQSLAASVIHRLAQRNQIDISFCSRTNECDPLGGTSLSLTGRNCQVCNYLRANASLSSWVLRLTSYYCTQKPVTVLKKDSDNAALLTLQN
jgi:hypothetical protein